MTFLVRFFIRHVFFGLAIAVVAVVLIIWSGVSEPGTLIRNAEQSLLAVVRLTVMMGLTFSSWQMGFAVMQLPGNKGPDSVGKRRLSHWFAATGLMPHLDWLQPVRVRVQRQAVQQRCDVVGGTACRSSRSA